MKFSVSLDYSLSHIYYNMYGIKTSINQSNYYVKLCWEGWGIDLHHGNNQDNDCWRDEGKIKDWFTGMSSIRNLKQGTHYFL